MPLGLLSQLLISSHSTSCALDWLWLRMEWNRKHSMASLLSVFERCGRTEVTVDDLDLWEDALWEDDLWEDDMWKEVDLLEYDL